MNSLSLLTLLGLLSVCMGSKILFVIPMPARSHYNLGDTLARELAGRGHEVTMVTPYSMSNPPKNVKEVVLSVTKEVFANKFFDDKKAGRSFGMRNLTPLAFLMFGPLGEVVVNKTMTSPAMVDFLKLNTQFDLVIGECFMTEGLLGGFSHKYNAPLVSIATFIPNTWVNELVGNPAPAAYIPEPILPFTNKMTFYERSINFFYGILAQIIYYNRHIPSQDRVMRYHFGKNMPPLKDLLQKTSLVLVNNHFSLAFTRPYLPNMIEVGGFHVKPPKPLPKDIQTFMDGAKDGVILFSMGSNLQSSDLPEEKFQEILKAFSKLKQRILWKFEEENPPNLPKNVKISKWLPQNDILAHPNIKLFLTHGGGLSLAEAVTRAVPLVAIPIFGDQPMNSKLIEEHGIGVALQYEDLTEQSLLNAIQKVLNNPKYAQNMKYRSTLLRDLPVTQLNTAVYWIEYVIRHKGAPHLRSGVQNLAWYQVYLLDVYAFLASVLFAFLYLLRALLKCCKSMCCKKKAKVTSSKKNK